MPPIVPVLVIEYWNLLFIWNLVLGIWNLPGKLRSQRQELFASGLPSLGLFLNKKPKCVCPVGVWLQAGILRPAMVWDL